MGDVGQGEHATLAAAVSAAKTGTEGHVVGALY